MTHSSPAAAPRAATFTTYSPRPASRSPNTR